MISAYKGHDTIINLDHVYNERHFPSRCMEPIIGNIRKDFSNESIQLFFSLLGSTAFSPLPAEL